MRWCGIIHLPCVCTTLLVHCICTALCAHASKVACACVMGGLSRRRYSLGARAKPSHRKRHYVYARLHRVAAHVISETKCR